MFGVLHCESFVACEAVAASKEPVLGFMDWGEPKQASAEESFFAHGTSHTSLGYNCGLEPEDRQVVGLAARLGPSVFALPARGSKLQRAGLMMLCGECECPVLAVPRWHLYWQHMNNCLPV